MPELSNKIFADNEIYREIDDGLNVYFDSNLYVKVPNWH